jgi:hypothetical protein
MHVLYFKDLELEVSLVVKLDKKQEKEDMEAIKKCQNLVLGY